MARYTIYMHIFPNGKSYVGITKQSVDARFKQGFGYESQQLMWRAIQKYGWDNIEHIVLADNLSKEWACKLEQDLIWKYELNNPEYGYNITSGGDGFFGHHSEETKEKLRQINLGKKVSDETRKKISELNKGRKHSDETKRKCSEKSKAYWDSLSKEERKLSEETRMKMSKSRSGENHPCYGKHRSEEIKQKISESKKGVPSKNKGRKMSDEFRQHLSEIRKGSHLSEATKEKLRQQALAQWKRQKGELSV